MPNYSKTFSEKSGSIEVKFIDIGITQRQADLEFKHLYQLLKKFLALRTDGALDFWNGNKTVSVYEVPEIAPGIGGGLEGSTTMKMRGICEIKLAKFPVALRHEWGHVMHDFWIHEVSHPYDNLIDGFANAISKHLDNPCLLAPHLLAETKLPDLTKILTSTRDFHDKTRYSTEVSTFTYYAISHIEENDLRKMFSDKDSDSRLPYAARYQKPYEAWLKHQSKICPLQWPIWRETLISETTNGICDGLLAFAVTQLGLDKLNSCFGQNTSVIGKFLWIVSPAVYPLISTLSHFAVYAMFFSLENLWIDSETGAEKGNFTIEPCIVPLLIYCFTLLLSGIGLKLATETLNKYIERYLGEQLHELGRQEGLALRMLRVLPSYLPLLKSLVSMLISESFQKTPILAITGSCVNWMMHMLTLSLLNCFLKKKTSTDEDLENPCDDIEMQTLPLNWENNSPSTSSTRKQCNARSNDVCAITSEQQPKTSKKTLSSVPKKSTSVHTVERNHLLSQKQTATLSQIGNKSTFFNIRSKATLHKNKRTTARRQRKKANLRSAQS